MVNMSMSAKNCQWFQSFSLNVFCNLLCLIAGINNDSIISLCAQDVAVFRKGTNYQTVYGYSLPFHSSPPSHTSFFHIGVISFILSIAYLQASKPSFL